MVPENTTNKEKALNTEQNNNTNNESNMQKDEKTTNPIIKVEANKLPKNSNSTSLKKVTEDNNLAIVKDNNKEIQPVVQENLKQKKSKISIISIILLLLAVLLLLTFSVFTIYNTTNTNIANGVFINGVDVSGLSKESAKDTINTFIQEHSADEIILTHNDYETSISLDQISSSFDIESAINEAYNINRASNVLENSFTAIKLLFMPADIDLSYSCDDDQLTKNLEEISPNLPDTVVESSYYIENNTLIITKGKTGNVVNVSQMKDYIKKQIDSLNFKGKKLNIITTSKSPAAIDIDSIYKEVHKEAKDAYFTKDPYALYPSENGVDFSISLADAKALLEKNQDEYQIPLKILCPNITTDKLGDEAFPNELSSFSTRYSSNANRTTNLILAADKINGTIVMPGETFSYNKTVGERTIAKGYKEAAIYVNGETVDGVGGGICQVATTLYEAALYANLEIVERSNHQFVPSYIGAGLDATVVYGLTDFKFKNNRNYPIKIIASVGGGSVYFQIKGLSTTDDYDVQISATSSKTVTSVNSVTYKTLSRNGQVISSEIISRDTYKRH